LIKAAPGRPAAARTRSDQRIKVVLPPRKGLSIEFSVNDETIGTVHKDVDDGEISYSIHLTVLEEDLPAPRPAAKPAAATPGRR
jgi:hypothetical protein